MKKFNRGVEKCLEHLEHTEHVNAGFNGSRKSMGFVRGRPSRVATKRACLEVIVVTEGELNGA